VLRLVDLDRFRNGRGCISVESGGGGVVWWGELSRRERLLGPQPFDVEMRLVSRKCSNHGRFAEGGKNQDVEE